MIRHSRTVFTAAIAATAVLAAFGLMAADAQPPANAAVAAKPSPADQAMMKFSEAGHAAIQGIRDARIAIFEGHPTVAMKLMAEAKNDLVRAEKDAPVYDTTTRVVIGGKTVKQDSRSQRIKRVPVDGQLALADNFVMTPEKQAHIDKANEHVRKGDRTKALEELRLGEIDVNYTRLWLPIVSATSQLKQAIQLASSGKYYQANLALKAIEDSTVVDSVTFSDLPRSGPQAKQ